MEEARWLARVARPGRPGRPCRPVGAKRQPHGAVPEPSRVLTHGLTSCGDTRGPRQGQAQPMLLHDGAERPPAGVPPPDVRSTTPNPHKTETSRACHTPSPST